MHSSPAYNFVLPFRSKYSPQHPIPKRPQSVFFPQSEKLNFTPTQNKSTVTVCTRTVLIFMFLDMEREGKRF
jgi:hypothetical protein